MRSPHAPVSHEQRVSEGVASRRSGERELLRIHVRTLFTHEDRGRLVCVNEPSGRPAPRFYLGRSSEGGEWRFRVDLDDALVLALEALCEVGRATSEFLSPAANATKYEELLARTAPVERRWAGPAYRFPRTLPADSGTTLITPSNSDLLRTHLADWLDDVGRCEPFVACIEDGMAVSVCCSGRRSPAAHEAAVETAEAFRGRGFATRAVAAWARAVRGAGHIPLYSTSWENVASRALAEKLGLICYGSDLHFT